MGERHFDRRPATGTIGIGQGIGPGFEAHAACVTFEQNARPDVATPRRFFP